MNRSYLDETEDVVRETQQATSAPTEGPAPDAQLSALFERARQLDEYDRSGPPMHMQLGMYQDDVFPHVRDMYLQKLHDRVIGPLLAADEQSMIGFRQLLALNAPPDAEEMKVMYDRLKVHLLLTEHGQLAEGLAEPPLDDELDDFLVGQLHHAWTEATGTERHEVAYRSMREQIRYYVEALHDSEASAGLRFERSDAAVGAVRAVFRQAGTYTLAVEGIIAEIEPLNYGVRMGSIVGRMQALQAGTFVRGAFTKRAWDERVEEMLNEDAARFFGDNWVLGNPPPEHPEREQEEQLARLRATYFQMYVLEWENFLASLSTPPLQDQEDQLVMLVQYTSGEPPIVESVIRALDTNVTLVPPEQASNRPNEVVGRGRRVLRQQGGTALGRLAGIGGGNARALMDEGDRRVQAALAERTGAGSMTPAMVRTAFLPLLEFAPPREMRPGAAENTTPIGLYQAHLEYMRDVLRQPEGSNLTPFEERQTAAQELTLERIEAQPIRWRNWFRAVLLPPVQGAAYERAPGPTLRVSVDMATLAAESAMRVPDGAGTDAQPAPPPTEASNDPSAEEPSLEEPGPQEPSAEEPGPREPTPAEAPAERRWWE